MGEKEYVLLYMEVSQLLSSVLVYPFLFLLFHRLQGSPVRLGPFLGPPMSIAVVNEADPEFVEAFETLFAALVGSSEVSAQYLITK